MNDATTTDGGLGLRDANTSDTPASGPARLRRGTTLGRYIVIDRLGRGGMGEVYSAWDSELRRRVALKLIHPRPGVDVRARALHEARALAQLRHAHIVAVHDVGQVDDLLFLAMDHLDGTHLIQWARDTRPNRAERLRVLLQVAEGLAAAHAQNIAHRDIKPTNVMVELLDGHPSAKLVDFGLASASEASDDEQVRGGTPAYMAPECRDGAPGDARSDQWSFAATAVELLGGHRPSPEEAASGSISGCGPAGTLLARALRTDPDARWPSMRALGLALRRAGGHRRAGLLGGLALVTAISVAAIVHGSPEPSCDERARAALESEAPRAQRRERLSALAIRAPNVARSASVALDAWTTAWVQGHAASCGAHDERGSDPTEQTSAQRCLRAQAGHVGSLLEVLASAQTERSGTWAVHAELSRTAQPDRCHDLSEPPVFDDPRLQRAGALEVAARYDEAFAIAQQTLDGLGDRDDVWDLRAAALYRLASIERRRDHAQAGLELGEQALQAAARASDRRTLVRALLERVEAWIVLGELTRATESAELARTAVISAGDPPDLLSYWHYERGRAHEASGDYLAAAQAYRRSLEIRQQTDPQSLYVADARRSLGYALMRAGRCDEATTQLRTSIEVYAARLGPSSPSEAHSASTLAQCDAQAGRYEDAFAAAERSVQILDQALGPRSIELAIALTLHGSLLASQGDYPGSVIPFRRAFEIRRDALGRDHSETLVAQVNLGSLLLTVGQAESAAPLLEDALQRSERLYGPDEPRNGPVLGAMAALEKERGHGPAALRYQRRAVLATEASPGAVNPLHRVNGLLNLGEILRDEGLVDEAATTYQQVRDLLDAHPDGHRHGGWPMVHVALGELAWLDARGPDARIHFDAALAAVAEAPALPGVVGAAYFGRARVRRAAGESLAAVRADVEAARDDFADEPTLAPQRRALEAWLEEQGP